MIRNQVTLKQLEAFVCVVDTGTFRKAASVLGTTQPNISARISAIEETLDVILMHRDAGSVKLTDKGTELLAAARQVLRATEDFIEVADRKDLIENRLRLGVAELVASTWLHDLLRLLKRQYPSIRIELIVDLSHEIENLLSEGQLDLALLSGPFRTKPTGLISLGTCRYGWVASSELVKDLPEHPEFSALFAKGILSHGKQTLASVDLRNHLEAEVLPPEKVVYSSSLASCLHMAKDGFGVALLPRQLFKDQLTPSGLVEISCSWEPKPLQFFARYDKKRAPRFVSQAAELAAGIAEDSRK